MKKTWNILYRGSLSSCNYACDYCPFAKTKNTRAELAKDRADLERFVAWVEGRSETIGILFTPWGEGLIRKYYQEAMTTLSHLPNVYRVAIQTNLSCPTRWMEKVNKESFALWTTYHPTEISREKFAAKCAQLDQMGIRYSVGFVGLKSQLNELSLLRQSLNPKVYLWVNAYKREPNYYTTEMIEEIEAIDPLFAYNNQYHPSKGEKCQAGHTTFTVDGSGNVRRCHFIKNKIGNIYQANFESNLYERNCSNVTCGCHIGYVHMDKLKLYEVYGKGVLERIPKKNVELRM